MKRIVWFGLCLVSFISTAAGYGAEQATEKTLTRRFAFIVGANRGGPGRVTLQYAVNDAKAIKKVLEDMGGVQAQDIWFLAEPKREKFFQEMQNLAEKINRQREKFRRLEVIFYYSGHSDEENMLTNGDRISYLEFRNSIVAMNADVRIAILDSCASGAFTTTKGVARRSPFLMDTAYDMKGNAFMTSSSATEVAQESDRLKSSFFTHNLIAGMRGAADMNRDDRITLSEAYQFAFNETLTQTEKTMNGPQHPNYHIQMSGTGDVVITEIWKSDAVLVLKEDVAGKIYIHNQQNALVMKLDKAAGREVSLGLNAGAYRIINISDQKVWEVTVSLISGKRFDVGHAQFEKIDKIPAATRGVMEPAVMEQTARTKKTKWQLEISGGISSLNPDDLNLRARIDKDEEDFYYARYFANERDQGRVSSLTVNSQGDLKTLKRTFPLDARLKYSLNDWLAVSLGLSYFSSSEKSYFKNVYDVIESGGPAYKYTTIWSPYTLAVEGLIPQIGIHANKKISRSLQAEALITAGPAIAHCSYRFNYNAAPLSSKNKILDYSELVAQELEEEGTGVGLALYGGGRISMELTRKLGFFLEGGYAYQVVRNVSGPGSNLVNGQYEDWEGEWGIKERHVQEEWGSIDLKWPSNAWKGNQIFMKTRDFKLDLSGVKAKVGIFYRF